MLKIAFLYCFLFIAMEIFFPVFEGAPMESRLQEKDRTKSVFSCSICNRLVNQVAESFDLGESDEEIASGIGDLCVESGTYNYKVCYGTALIAMPTLRFIFSQEEFILGNACGIFLQTEGCRLSNPNELEWSIPPSSVPKPPVTQPTPPPEGSPTLKVLHLADVHWDPEYQEGSLATCDDTVCCRNSSGTVVNQADAAGYWGDYRVCDSPWRTVENAVAQIARQHPYMDYIVWTGDLVPHDVWDTTKDENIMINDKLLSLMSQYFPNTPLYPTLGNHEAHPVDTFSPPEIQNLGDLSISWLYDEADVQWSRWLPGDVSFTVRYGGYYTTLVRPGLRIVSMNNNYCYTGNWWTLLKSQDPGAGLLWLNQVLEEAEEAGEKVHIMSHIPPGNRDCWTVFSREFNKIINRFESTVAAQFYGHTHSEEYKLFYDETDGRPVNVAFVGGSLTTYTGLNPGFRVYTVDARPDSFAVLDFSNWIMNLTEANEGGPNRDPIWYELYQAKKEYGLADLSPASMNELFNRMVDDEQIFQLYVKNWYKGNYNIEEDECDSACRKKLLCFIITTDPAVDCTVAL